MREALLAGKLGISALSPRVTTGKEQWQEWHHDFFHNQQQDYIQVPSVVFTQTHSSQTGAAMLQCARIDICGRGMRMNHFFQ